MTNAKLLTFGAYALGIPALYIVLTEKHREEFVGYHGGQALILWVGIFAIFFGLRFLVNLIWSFFYIPYLDLIEVLAGSGLWAYAIQCGLRSWRGETFELCLKTNF